jgi:hypothetical protein
MSAEPQTPRLLERRSDRFFAVMAVLAAVITFAGFSRTYYLGGFFGAKALTPFFHLHGVVFSCWILLFVVQAVLARSGRIRLHRRLGMTSLILVPAMIVIGVMAAIDMVRRGASPTGGAAIDFFVVPMMDLVVFGSLVGAALWLRRKPQDHKRLMLLATISILTPAIARLPGIEGPLMFLGLTDLLIVVCIVFDKLAHGRVHRAFLWGGLFIVASQPLRFALGKTEAWLTFARWLTR